MSDAKTAPTDVAPEEYIAAVQPDAKQEDARRLDEIFRRVTGEAPRMWGPSIIGYGSYSTKYASGRDVTWMRAGFSPRKAKHSLYLMGGYCDEQAGKRRDEQLARLGKHSRGKSCLYINKLADVDQSVLEDIIAEDWAVMNRLYPE
ncbi:DUF1801 domain-containing protein [Pontixanthobacter luteolus]|uniref:DUF1801 domain-containing protein n=1 Tax=Pontixanthobacter luteolus TaxID=295089 RepID=UPI00230480FF|nr:DUF1801 domain-containing protein [Pontixanthobacter luteolus]